MKLNCVNQSDLSLIAEKTKMKITKKKKKRISSHNLIKRFDLQTREIFKLKTH